MHRCTVFIHHYLEQFIIAPSCCYHQWCVVLFIQCTYISSTKTEMCYTSDYHLGTTECEHLPFNKFCNNLWMISTMLCSIMQWCLPFVVSTIYLIRVCCQKSFHHLNVSILSSHMDWSDSISFSRFYLYSIAFVVGDQSFHHSKVIKMVA